ncbi:contact-dependent growth inhibition system immunity protein [Intrasporangium sp. YIM S08009]|uniref:contact-dependent growth inhibition system immunity protein n=1 Tax=Intrasporangium zincisolvens TaxID=3080018 RepID=UPI002B06169F|nr:contact-dependent growth inhibition system immunity protein [Intrasporangium sp. YIM S08009]
MTHQLEHLAKAYFHQDYDLDSGSVSLVIDSFREGEGEASAAELVSEIDRLLASHQSDRDLRDLWSSTGAAYDPHDDGHNMREWLTRVRDRLSQGPL